MDTQETLEIGASYNVAPNVVAKVVAKSKTGYLAEQVYKDRVHEVLIPFACVGNPHYSFVKV